MKLLIKNGTVIDPVSGQMNQLDLFVEHGKIAMLEPSITQDADEVVDATGYMVAPGLVDMHVHFRDPGFEHKEDIMTGTQAAAQGGVTAVACMANTKPVADTPETLEYIKNRAQAACGVRVYPVGAVSKGLSGQELTDADGLKVAGAVALSDDGRYITQPELMRNAMIKARIANLPVLCNCEDSSMTQGRAVNEGSISRKLWLEGRPAIAEELGVMRDCMLAQETRAAIHICHVSTARSVEIIRQMKAQGVAVTCETCPHYFSLTEDEVLTQGTFARVSPPLRTEKDIRGLIKGLRDGTIDAIASDHAPHDASDKARSLERASSGIPGLETLLAVSLTKLYHSGKMELPELIHRLSTAPANILNIPGGRLMIGTVADIVIFDPVQEWMIDPAQFASKAKYSPFAGQTVRGKVKCTIAGGKPIYQEAYARVSV